MTFIINKRNNLTNNICDTKVRKFVLGELFLCCNNTPWQWTPSCWKHFCFKWCHICKHQAFLGWVFEKFAKSSLPVPNSLFLCCCRRCLFWVSAVPRCWKSVVYLNVQIEEPRSDHSSFLSYQTISLVSKWLQFIVLYKENLFFHVQYIHKLGKKL